MTAPMVDYKIHWLKMMSVTESRAVVGRHDGINGRDSGMVDKLLASYDAPKRAAKAARKKGVTAKRSRKKTARARA